VLDKFVEIVIKSAETMTKFIADILSSGVFSSALIGIASLLVSKLSRKSG